MKLIILMTLYFLRSNLFQAEVAADKKKVSSKIAGGDIAVEGDFPYHVVLSNRNLYLGGGSLIKPDWVLTVRQLKNKLRIQH